MKEKEENVYQKNGYKDREDYLNTLADDMGIDEQAVHLLADLLGPSEYFDGLVSNLDDFQYVGLLDKVEA